MAIQPIRLFGDPVLRTPAQPVVDFDKELRRLVKDLTDTMLDAPRRRPGRARRSASACGSSPTTSTASSATWSTRRSTCPTRSRTARRAACRSPGSPSTPTRALRVVAKGFEHARRAGRHRGLASCSPARSSTRPTTSTASCSSTGSTRGPAQARDEGDPRGGLVRHRHARRQGLPARDLRQGACSCGSSSPAPPRPPLPVARRARSPRRHELVAVVTRPDAPAGRGRTAAPLRRSRERAEELGVQVLKPATPRDPDFLERLRRPRPRLLPGRRLRRAAAAGARSTCPGTAGSTCTSRCCPPGGAPPRCSTRSWPATRSPAPPPSGSSRASTPARSSA